MIAEGLRAIEEGRASTAQDQDNNFICMAERKSWKKGSGKGNKYDDWMCLLCQNHNYSFRQICNRCHVQTKQQNGYMTLLYQQQLEFEQATSSLSLPHALEAKEVFPNVVLLVINEEPWEEYPQIWEVNKPLNVQWIHHLIED